MLNNGDCSAAAQCNGPCEAVLQFGPFVLSRSRKLLLDRGSAVPLGGRALELLRALSENAGKLMTRQQLMELVWPNTVVEENSLRVHIAALRKALGDGQNGARYIANVPGRGYVFVAEVRRLNLPAPRVEAAVQAISPLAYHLPTQLASVIGRSATVALLAAQLAERRLVSIVGPGGIGKTTVALAVAAAVRHRFAAGVCFVDLSAINSDDLLPSAVAGALGVASATPDVLLAICRFVSGRNLLIILDNCEHVAEGAAHLVERLLISTEDIKVLVTTREALYVQTEWVHRLVPLAAPASGAGQTVEQALAFPAVQLFAVRAAANASAFALDASNVESVIFLCNELDGNALAIELAAARVASLGVEGLVSRMGNLFGLLTQGRRTAYPRHQTLQAMVDWSYQLLDDAERTVFRRLAVFRGRFSLDWAVSVATCEHISDAKVTECLFGLGDKSLLVVETGSASGYRLLNTTRRYAEARLEESPDADLVATRHARCMLALYTTADKDLKVLEASQWRNKYGATAGDFKSALDWAFSATGEPMVGIEMVAVSWFCMLEMGRIDEHRQRIKAALYALSQREARNPELEARLLSAELLISAHSSQGADIGEYCARLHELIEQIGSPELSLQVLHCVGSCSIGHGHYPLLESTARRVMALAAARGDLDATILGERLMATGQHYLGEHRSADALAQRVLGRRIEQRPVHFHGLVRRDVTMRVLRARIRWIQGFPDQASELAGEALLHAEGQNPLAMAIALGMAAIPVAFWRGDNATAAVYYERLTDGVTRHSLGYWDPWIAGFGEVLGLRAGPAMWQRWRVAEESPVLHDLLGTFSEDLATEAVLSRVSAGVVGWCAPEILRARGVLVLRTRAQGCRAEAERLFMDSIALARHQKALSWELRTATSLARLWQETGQAAAGLALLAEVCQRFSEGRSTSDYLLAQQCLQRVAVPLSESI